MVKSNWFPTNDSHVCQQGYVIPENGTGDHRGVSTYQHAASLDSFETTVSRHADNNTGMLLHKIDLKREKVSVSACLPDN